jgi:hypothetical protein
MNKIALMLLLLGTLAIAHYGYGEQTVIVLNESLIMEVGTIIPLDNITFIENISESNESTDEDTTPKSKMNVTVLVDCLGIHVLADVESDPIAGADVTVYMDPKNPFILLSSGQTNEDGEYSFNTSAQNIGIIVSKKGYKYYEGLFEIPSINCSINEVNETTPENNITETTENESINETQIVENETINETKDVTEEPQTNQTIGAPSAPKEQDTGLADFLLPVLIIAAAVIVYFVFRGGKVSVNPMPPPKEKKGDVSVNPMPPPSPEANPMPPPKGKEGDVSVNPMPPPKGKI